MSTYKAWAAKQAGNPTMLVIGIVGLTISAFGAYRYAYKPWERRRKLGEAERYTEFLFERENAKK